jgi:hypothetical protein
MNSLEYLNGISSTSISYTDNRATNVIFDRPNPKNIAFTETTTSFSAHIGIEIVEIIQPTTANVRFKINLGTSNASVDFGLFSEDLSLVNNDTVWTIYGIKTLDHWNSIKSPTITLDEDYFGDVSYDVTILYDTDTATNLTKEFSVGYFVPAVQMQPTITMDVTPNVIYDPLTNLYSYTVFKFYRYAVQLVSRFTLEAEGVLLNTVSSQFSMNADVNVITDTDSALTSSTNLSVDATKIDFITTTIPSSEVYTSNIANTILDGTQFNPYATDVFVVLVTPDTGHIMYDSSGYEHQGWDAYQHTFSDATDINNNLTTIKWCPPYNYTGSSSYNVKVYYAGILMIDEDVSLTNSGTGSISTRYIEQTSSTNLSIAFDEYLYGKFDYDIIGAGGSGAGSYGGGGAGGTVDSGTLISTNINDDTVTSDSRTAYFMKQLQMTLGTGGSPASTTGNAGGSTLFKYYNTSDVLQTITATGGDGGLYYTSGVGSDGGDNADYNGGEGFSSSAGGGGGGAGSAGNGSNATLNAGIYTGGAGGAGVFVGSGFTYTTAARGGNGGGTSNPGTTYDYWGSGSGGGTNSAGKNGAVLLKIYAK